MHELLVTQSILQLALEHAPEERQITDLYLVLGDLASIVDDSVQFYWDLISEGTAAAGATLHFRRVAAQMCCHDCAHEFSPKVSLACPACHSRRVTVIAGEEFYLESIAVEQ